jgi:hypothetical protein
LNNTLSNDYWVIKEIREEILKFLLSAEMKRQRNLHDRAKAILREHFMTMNAYIKRSAIAQKKT